MPLPGHKGVIAMVLEQFRKRDNAIIQVSLVPGLILLIGLDILRHSTKAGYICFPGVRKRDLFRNDETAECRNTATYDCRSRLVASISWASMQTQHGSL